MSSNTQSYLSAELAVTLAVVAAGIGYGYYARTQQHQAEAGSSGKQQNQAVSAGGKKKGKKGKAADNAGGGAGPATPQVVPFPAVLSGSASVPGSFDGGEDVESSDVAAAKTKKPGKKSSKAKQSVAEATTPGVETPRASPAPPAPQESEADASSAAGGLQATASQSKKKKNKAKKTGAAGEQKGGHQLERSMASIDTDSSWTRVEPKPSKSRTANAASTANVAASTSSEPTTGDSSPVAGHGGFDTTEDEGNHRDDGEGQRKKTFAEKMLPKGRKTGVEDLLETPDYPTLSRVMRIAPPSGAKPVDGYSWGDYEDVEGEDGGREDNDDDGWGVVKSRKTTRSSTPPSSQILSSSSQSEKLSKTQKKNAKRKDALKEAKALHDKEQEARAAEHRRALERQRIIEQSQKSSRGKTVGGGMKATVENGKLVWE